MLKHSHRELFRNKIVLSDLTFSSSRKLAYTVYRKQNPSAINILMTNKAAECRSRHIDMFPFVAIQLI